VRPDAGVRRSTATRPVTVGKRDSIAPTKVIPRDRQNLASSDLIQTKVNESGVDMARPTWDQDSLLANRGTPLQRICNGPATNLQCKLQVLVGKRSKANSRRPKTDSSRVPGANRCEKQSSPPGRKRAGWQMGFATNSVPRAPQWGGYCPTRIGNKFRAGLNQLADLNGMRLAGSKSVPSCAQHGRVSSCPRGVAYTRFRGHKSREPNEESAK